jgi:protein-disulfide isomerase
VRDFPIERIHPQAFRAAEAAHCAGAQGKFWEMHARLFANQRALDLNDLMGHARALGLEGPKFHKCLESGTYAERIRGDLADGQKAGVTGTPAFFLGLTRPDEPTINALIKISGALPYQGFKDAIDSLLSVQQ